MTIIQPPTAGFVKKMSKNTRCGCRFLDFVFYFQIWFSVENVLADLENAQPCTVELNYVQQRSTTPIYVQRYVERSRHEHSRVERSGGRRKG